MSTMSLFPFDDHPVIIKKDHTDTELTSAKLAGVIIMSFLNVFMFLGNTMSIVTICSSRCLRQQVSYWFVLNLSIIDLTISTTVVPLNTTWEYFGVWSFSQTVCDFMTFADIAFSTISAYSIALVSVDKYIYITYAIHYPEKMTRKLALILIASVWCCVFVLAGVFVFLDITHDEEITKLTEEHCMFVTTDDFILAEIVICFFVPLGVLCFTSTRIVCIARRHIRKIRDTSSSTIHSNLPTGGDSDQRRNTLSGSVTDNNPRNSIESGTKISRLFHTDSSLSLVPHSRSSSCSRGIQSDIRRESITRQRPSMLGKQSRRRPYCKLLGTTTIVIFTFILMFAPYFIASAVDVWCHCVRPWVYEDILAVLYYMHSLVNPYIYIATDRKYKAAVKRLWKRFLKSRCGAH